MYSAKRIHWMKRLEQQRRHWQNLRTRSTVYPVSRRNLQPEIRRPQQLHRKGIRCPESLRKLQKELQSMRRRETEKLTRSIPERLIRNKKSVQAVQISGKCMGKSMRAYRKHWKMQKSWSRSVFLRSPSWESLRRQICWL